MPAPTQDVFVPPIATTSIEVMLAPARNAFHSLLLLKAAEDVSGLDDWVTRTLAQMTEEERARHRLVLSGFYYAIEPDRLWPDFPAYVDHLAAMPPTALRDRVLEVYSKINDRKDGDAWPAIGESILESEDAYLTFLRHLFGDDHFDEDIEREAYAYLVKPEALQELAVSHLRHVWDKYLAAEWARVEPMLQEAVAAFGQVALDDMERAEAVQFVTGRELPGETWERKVMGAERLIFVPSAHMGPYLGAFHMGDAMGILFGARLPEELRAGAPDLSRNEIVVRLSALADDTRLRILKFVAEAGEQRSQSIMERLDLSQSATSRHLKQLSATGYLSERRCNGAKCYRLNPERIEDTLQSVAAYLID